jgi:hypothetical protein
LTHAEVRLNEANTHGTSTTAPVKTRRSKRGYPEDARRSSVSAMSIQQVVRPA